MQIIQNNTVTDVLFCIICNEGPCHILLWLGDTWRRDLLELLLF